VEQGHSGGSAPMAYGNLWYIRHHGMANWVKIVEAKRRLYEHK
jgi:hypothetical protein